MNGYVDGLMRQYGNNGRRWELPQRDPSTFEAALRFRGREKEYYATMEENFNKLQCDHDELLHIHNLLSTEFDTLLSDLNTYNVGNGDRRGDDSGDGGGRGGVLPSVQSNTQAREEELKLSNAQPSKTDERSNASGSRSGGLPALPEDVPSESVGEGEREAAGAEWSDPAADLGGQTGEHGTEE